MSSDAGDCPRGAFGRLAARAPGGQVLRYLAVGAFNTLWAYALFAALNHLLSGIVPHAYMLAALLGSWANITVAYLGYKVFVFRTKGNYVREYLRCFAVYGAGIIVNLISLPVLVSLCNVLTNNPRTSPYIAAALLSVVNVLLSFVGHKSYSFRAPVPNPKSTAAAAEHFPIER